MKSKNKKASHNTSDLKRLKVKEDHKEALKWLKELAEEIREKKKNINLAG